jgi:hypothetical protein
MDHLLRKGKHAEGISSVSPTNSWPGYQALKKTSIVVSFKNFHFFNVQLEPCLLRQQKY